MTRRVRILSVAVVAAASTTYFYYEHVSPFFGYDPTHAIHLLALTTE
jgi:hypothetical protein